MRKISLLVLLAVLAPSCSGSQNNAGSGAGNDGQKTFGTGQQIAGTDCMTAGEIKVDGTKRYICQGEGRQDHFQWDDGTSLDFSAQIPITLPVAPDTTPNGITFENVMSHISEIPKTAWQKIQDVIEKNPPLDVPHTLDVGPNTSSVTKSLEESLLSREFRLWEGFEQTNFLSIVAYNSKDTDWAQTQLKSVYQTKKYPAPQDPEMFLHLVQQTCSAFSKPGQVTGPMGDCDGGNAGAIEQSDDSMEMLGITIKDPKHPYDPTQSGLVSHEYTHTVQAAQFIGTASRARSYYVHIWTPCWLHEGQPNATGMAAASTSFEQYLSSRENSVMRGQIDPNFPGWSASALKQYLYSQITNESDPKSCYQNGPLYKMGYSVGMAATEALVAIGGPESTMALIALQANGNNFAESFVKVYGITWDEGSTILGQVLAAEYAKDPFQSH